ncbi:hypothetical protein EP1X_01120 [Thermococcus sp. EP1]|uniref:class III signal peptide-containing protein n=1 Tax=Thermococcus sp. EP1 TaxID=1591054 RepID=UPI0006DBB538|nr:class III signal peptide-containing protein [Thermococcus sp. EP1]KPU63828.1 hypothetical protein EP1X_01120 [Thermococcus sp. EP1]
MKKGQISLEFLFIFILFLVLLTFSIRNITFSSENSADMLRIQVSEEAKLFANTVSNAISQVYAQGPGAKTTEYFTFRYLNDEYFLKKAFAMNNKPYIVVGYQNGTYVTILEFNETIVFTSYDTGTDTLSANMVPIQSETDALKKNFFLADSLYRRDLSNASIYSVVGIGVEYNGTTYSPSVLNLNITPYNGILLFPEVSPTTLKIVVEWNPDRNESWIFNSTAQELRINLNVGG